MNFAEAVEEYLAHRRAEGTAYTNQAGCLRSLAALVGNKDLERLRTEDLGDYFRAEGFIQATVSKRFTLIAKFMKFHQDRGRATAFKMPPRPRYIPQEFTSHIYTPVEVRNILDASRSKKQGTIPAETFETLVLFLYATGCSLYSAVQLRAEHLDLDKGVATVENQRGNGSRTIPLNQSLLDVLAKYVSWKSAREIRGGSFFVRRDGTSLVISTFGLHFRTILRAAQCCRRDGFHDRPRLHDFRATFAVQRISEWIKSGADLGRMLPALAAYMGMVDLTVTEQYLTLSPERFRKELQKLSASTQSAI